MGSNLVYRSTTELSHHFFVNSEEQPDSKYTRLLINQIEFTPMSCILVRSNDVRT